MPENRLDPTKFMISGVVPAKAVEVAFLMTGAPLIVLIIVYLLILSSDLILESFIFDLYINFDLSFILI